ncbi:MAG: DUF1385 domain-containing protein [Acidobacteria bacterium]|nr:DUF1385 domain-containing protein [Acidobacteriota bacterium]
MHSVLGKIRQFFRLSAHLQLMPVLESGEELLVGGQAVIEGVMMRAPHSYCVSVRRPDGSVAAERAPLVRPSERRRIFKYPVFRGLGTLGQAMILGFKALRFSANAALETEPGRKESKPAPISNSMMALNVLFSVGFFLFLYKFVPLFLVTQLRNQYAVLGHYFFFNLADGLVRMAIFLLFLGILSLMKDIRRVFEYHGAEHKVVFNYESGRPVEIGTAQTFSTLHQRCGTSFLLVVMTISMLIYALAPFQSFGLRLLSRVLLLPLVAGLSYEVIRFAAKRRGTLWASMVAPGLWLQKITTKPPSDDQVEISISSLEGAMALEKQQGGELVIS